MNVEWTARALRDVATAYARLAEESESAAKRFAARLLAAGNSLEQMPLRGRQLEDGRRLLVIERYLLYYRLRGASVRILHVVHGARR